MTKKCPNCGKTIPEEAAFCLYCFTQLDTKKPISTSNTNNKKSKGIALCISLCLIICIIVACTTIFAKNNTSQSNTTTNVMDVFEKAEQSSQTETTSPTQQSTEKTEKTTTKKAKAKAKTSTTSTDSTTDISTTEEETTKQKSKSTKKKKSTTSTATTGFDYEIVDNGIKITKYLGSESSVTINSTIDNRPVIEIAPYAFSNNNKIKSIVFANSTKMLTLYANSFYNLASLKSITFPSKVNANNFATAIQKCQSLQSINISSKYNRSYYQSKDGVVTSGSKIVYYPPGKTNSTYTISYDITEIQANAFKDNRHLRSIRFSKRENLKCNWTNLFSSVPNLNAIYIYPGTSADLNGIQHFDGEIIYYD